MNDENKAEETETKPKAGGRGKAKTNVTLADLRRGTEDSDSVRALQAIIAEHVPKSLQPEVTGDYDEATVTAVRAWQVSNDYAGARGIKLSEEQATKLFGESHKLITD